MTAKTRTSEDSRDVGRAPAGDAAEDVRDWLQHAACAGRDPDLWFHAGSRRRRIALAICAGCTVARHCGELGREIGASGVWGGRLLSGSGQG